MGPVRPTGPAGHAMAPATRCVAGATGGEGGADAAGQPFARACTRSKAPLNLSWSPTVGPVEVYCQIV